MLREIQSIHEQFGTSPEFNDISSLDRNFINLSIMSKEEQTTKLIEIEIEKYRKLSFDVKFEYDLVSRKLSKIENHYEDQISTEIDNLKIIKKENLHLFESIEITNYKIKQAIEKLEFDIESIQRQIKKKKDGM